MSQRQNILSAVKVMKSKKDEEEQECEEEKFCKNSLLSK